LDDGSAANWQALANSSVTIRLADHTENDQRVGVLELIAFETLGVEHQPAIEGEADCRNDTAAKASCDSA